MVKKRLKDVSIITTVLNESENIKEFLNSIIQQSVLPREFIIVDGGSTDDTYKILKKYSKKYKWIKVYQAKGASIGKGRNIAIEKAKGKIIAVTDAGCIVDKKWLENLYKTYKKYKGKYEVISGIYECVGDSFLQKAISPIVCLDNKNISEDIEPSSRSVMFTKKVWKRVGGYPDSSTADDAVFNIKLKLSKVRFKTSRSSKVYWIMRPTLKSFVKQFFRYGYGDGIYRIPFQIKKLSRNKDVRGSFLALLYGILSISIFFASIIVDYKLLIVLLCLFLLDFFKKIKGKRVKIYLLPLSFILLIIKRFSYFAGLVYGLLNRGRKFLPSS